ncbi:hypothetical protein FNYG_15889 [Fusarium nygamai]|uniref:Uncharacterized protein n=1 Tax=Gibberella nygamai TaxID=42673 RepID=A0A2K0U1G0_GIBNY|nr:hypothetical protein FNYG_15889 [Fusarium nygamai]
MARSNHEDEVDDPPRRQYGNSPNSAHQQQQGEHFDDHDDGQRSISPQPLGNRRTARQFVPQPRYDDESGDDDLNPPPQRSRQQAGRRSILYNPREQEDDVINQIAENESVLAWDKLIKYPRARVSHLKYLPWWREEVQKRYEVYKYDEFNQAKLITARRPYMGAAPETQTAGPPVPRDNLSEGSDDDSSSRRRRETTAYTMQSAVSDISKKIRKETLGIFDPDNPDDRDRQGLITTSTGKTIYTDVFMFCEHLYLFKRYGEFSLTEYYVGMLTGKASAWLMSELDGASRNHFLSLPITDFGRKLTERFKRPDTEILEDLYRTRFTPRLVLRGITLAQWAQRKAGLAKQVGYNEDHTIVTTLFNQIDIEIQRFLEHPKETTSLIAFIRQCEQRRTTIEHFCRHSDRGDKGEHRYKSDRYSGRDKGSRSD